MSSLISQLLTFFWGTWYFCFFSRVPSPSHCRFWLGLWRPHWCSMLGVSTGKLQAGRSRGMGTMEKIAILWERVFFIPKTAAAKNTNQKPPTTSCWNLSRRHGWDFWKKRKKIIQGIHKIVYYSAGGNHLWPLNPRRKPGENSVFPHSRWFWQWCWYINCFWWAIITSLYWRGQYWRHKPGFSSATHCVGERRRIFLVGGGGGMAHYMYWPDSW